MGAYTAASVMVMAMIGPINSRAPVSAAFNGVSPSRDVPLHVLHDHDGVIHHQPDPDSTTTASSVEQIDREPEHLHQEDRADERERDGDDRDDDRPQRAGGKAGR